MSGKVLSGVDPRPGAQNVATIRRYRCQHCGEGNEIRWVGWVPAAHYNEVAEYVRAAAGDEFVLLPVQTLNQMGEDRERLANRVRELEGLADSSIPLEQHRRAIANVMDMEMLRRCHEDRAQLKQQLRRLTREAQ